LAASGVLYRKKYPIPQSWWIGGGLIVAAFLAAWLAGGPLQEALYPEDGEHAEGAQRAAVHLRTWPLQVVDAEKLRCLPGIQARSPP
jgi:hypothetical protein